VCVCVCVCVNCPFPSESESAGCNLFFFMHLLQNWTFGTDWVKVNVALNTEEVTLEMFLPANLLAVTEKKLPEKQAQIQTKSNIHN